MKITLIRLGLWIVIGVALYFLIDVVYADIHFQKEKTRIETKRVRRLEKIRELQFAFRDEHKRFASKWDSLLQFGKQGEFTIVKTIGDPNDTTVEVVRDTFKVNVVDSLFHGQANMVDSLPYIPLSKENKKFSLEADKINLRNVLVDVFKVVDTDPFDPEDDPLTLGSLQSANFDINREYK